MNTLWTLVRSHLWPIPIGRPPAAAGRAIDPQDHGTDEENADSEKQREQADADGDSPPLPVMANPRYSIGFGLLAACCGFALIVLPFSADSLSIGLQPFRWPIVVVGLAAVSAALGAQAVARHKLFSAGGMAAIVVIFASVFAQPKPGFIYGYIRGTQDFRSVVVAGSSPFLTGRLADGGHFHFFAREDEVKGQVFSVSARNLEGKLPAQVIIGCIPIALLRKFLGNSDGLDLTIFKDPDDAENQRWKLVLTTQSSPLGQWGNPGCETGRSRLDIAALPSALRTLLVSPAHAEDSSRNVARFLQPLEQGDFASQVRAQDEIARLRDAPTITAIVDRWQAPWRTQVDTGLLVAWVRAIRRDRAVAVPIASAMSEAQLDHLVDLTGSRDRTIRYNAVELISWILQATGWAGPPPSPQVSKILEAILRPYADTESFVSRTVSSPFDASASAYNTLVAVADAKCDMRPRERDRLSATLGTFEASVQVQAFQLEKTAMLARQIRNKRC